MYLSCMKSLWSETQTLLKNQLEHGHYQVWIAPLQAELLNGQRLGLKLFAPTDFVVNRVKDRYLGIIAKAASIVAQQEIELEISKGTASEPLPAAQFETPAPDAEGVASELRDPASSGTQVGLPLNYSVPTLAKQKYSFDSFVVGPSNQLAFSAAQTLCGELQQSVNTLFLTSGPGLGKTHLVQAMGYSLKQSARNCCKIACLTAEEFGSRMVAAIRARETENFKARYRDIDVLLLEDIHFLQGKEKMQDEVLSTIKCIRDRGGRVVFSSSFAPHDLKDLCSQLASRFCAGFLATIEPPCFETRKAIFTQKASLQHIALPDPVAELLAEHVRSDVRKIESCLHNLILQARLLNQEISIELACSVLKQYASQETLLDFDSILRTVCHIFGLNLEELSSKTRRAACVSARNAAFFLARKHTDLTLAEIGQRLNRTHTSVIKGISSLEREISRQTPLGRQLNQTLLMIERNSRPSA